MSSIISNAISGLPINNGSSISINNGRTSRNYNHYTSANFEITDVDKFQDKFHHDYLEYYLWPPYSTSNNSPAPTSTVTPSATVIAQTSTATPTATQTPTATLTPTQTSTITPSPTLTSTITPTPTVSPIALITTNTANFGNCAGTLSNVGTNGISSAYGVYDFGGNVWEWLEINVGTSNRVFRGGNYSYSVDYLSSSYRNYTTNTSRLSYLGFRIGAIQLDNTYADMIYVGDIDNSSDINGFGKVAYGFYIGTYEVTNTEYVEFLNAVASTDTYSLYIGNMSSTTYGGINRSGSVGNYTYSTKTNMGNRPVNYVNWSCGARYANWLHNGKPTGGQVSGVTEDGAYTMSNTTPLRNNNAKYFLPLENEWYKAAFYKGGGTNSGYWIYPTQSNTAPTCITIDSNGDAIIL